MDDQRAYWEAQAASFDDEPDHGLRDPVTRDAWRRLLRGLMPATPGDVVDLGCGTGSLAVLLAEDGHGVRGTDLAEAMVTAARVKAEQAGVDVEVRQGDAGDPAYAPGSCDVVLARHVLWALPRPDVVLARWVRLLRPGGRLVLVEGRWSTGVGLRASELESLVLAHRAHVETTRLQDPALWGGPVRDERYVALSLR